VASIIDFFNKIKNGLIVALTFISAMFIGLFVFEKKKAEVQTELKDNAITQNKVESISNEITNVQNQTKEEENAPVTKDDLLNFLNDPNKPK
jgi:hypothetical protein